MKKLLIGAGTALTALALAGGGVSAQTSYVLEGEFTVAGASTCTTVTQPPQLDYTVTYDKELDDPTLTLSFEADGTPFGSPVVVPTFTGVIAFPTDGNGTPGGYQAEGWTIQAGLWFDGPDADVDIIATLVDTDGTATAEAAITYDFEAPECLAALPPVTTVPGVTPPTPTPQPVPPAPPVQPVPPTPVVAPPPLPSAGLSTFETGMRIGALLLMGGLGFMIVARRRRFAAPTAA